MKLLLTSSGISNPSINNALVELLGKPISECNALCIPTAIYPFSVGPSMAYKFITGTASSPMCGLGWKSLGVLELTALPSVKRENWASVVQEADALLVFGGDVLYLRYWMRESGLADLFASLPNMVYVGVSAGSMVIASEIAETYTHSKPPDDEDIKSEEISLATPEGEAFNITLAVAPGLGQTDFALIPHVENERFPENSLASIEKWVSKVSVPLYAIDDQTAIKVAGGNVEVISEGEWKLFP
ncbi:MAG TPA: Type 1 glutamine amidotransferase-like domain-containing protein [Fimbriimonadaceae bacterium]|jgi:dipeptidase E